MSHTSSNDKYNSDIIKLSGIQLLYGKPLLKKSTLAFFKTGIDFKQMKLKNGKIQKSISLPFQINFMLPLSKYFRTNLTGFINIGKYVHIYGFSFDFSIGRF